MKKTANPFYDVSKSTPIREKNNELTSFNDGRVLCNVVHFCLVPDFSIELTYRESNSDR